MTVSLPYKTSSAPEPELRIYLLGEPYLLDSKTGKILRIPARCMSLLAFLILNRKQRLRQTIAAALWPGLSYDVARANLRRILFKLLRALPEGGRACMAVDGQRLAWIGPARVWCDIEAFDRTSDDERTRSEALELYGGELLLGDESEWLVEHRNRLREKHRALLERSTKREFRHEPAPGTVGRYESVVR